MTGQNDRQRADSVTEVFRLGPGMREAMIAHARAGALEEVCGIISGKAGTAAALYPGRNVSPTPRVTYEMDVDTLMKQIDFEEAGLMLAAIYHSHPAGPPTPSATDIARAAYPDAVYIICSLADPAASSLRGFRIVDGAVREVALSE